MVSRKIVIGDLHGCIEETSILLDKVNFDPSSDQVFFTGDLIHRGPYSLKCFELYKKINAKSVLGNHELEHLMVREGKWQPSSRVRQTIEEFEDLYNFFLNSISSWPLYISEDEFTLIHGGLLPDHSPDQMSAQDITSIRYLPSDNGDKIPWFDSYHDEKLLIFGHWSLLGGLDRPNLLGIDMGCVYGRGLRGVIFPGRIIVDVPAIKQHYKP